MNDFEPRRCQQQSHGTFLQVAIACLLVCACDDGIARPLVLSDASVDGGGSSALGSSTAGRRAARVDASVDDDDDDVTETTECAKLRSTWPARFAADEVKLIEQINLMRSNATAPCAAPFTLPQPLEADPRFQCTARLRLPEDSSVRAPNTRPSIMPVYDLDQKSQEPNGLRDRQKRAGLKEARVVAEFVFYNVGNVEGIFEALREDPEAATDFCMIATTPFLTLVGAARYANVWVLDFGGAPPSTHPTNSGTGNSGSGTSGTGGR
jgi:hypothetical protein